MNKKVRILHLYAKEMNIYGDRGNVLTLSRRLAWRGFEPEVVEAGIDEKADIASFDLLFAGGGQDRIQTRVGQDLLARKAGILEAAGSGMPMLLICGTYQLFGRRFVTLGGEEIPGIGLFGAETRGGRRRLIGNVVEDTPFGRLVGFENHSGETLLDDGQEPLGKVVKGFGNTASDGHEGARLHNVIGTYLHGPVLPKNPALADHLLLAALGRKFGIAELPALDDTLEHQSAEAASRRPR